MNKIKVAIVEDDIYWLKVMTNFLSNNEDIVVIGSADDKDNAINLAKSMINIDVILMDINLNSNKCDGIYAASEITQFSKAKIIMMTSLREDEIIKDSFTAGAVNYISKENFKDIPNAIRSAYSNTSFYEVVLQDYIKLKEYETLNPLSPAEKDVMNLAVQGYSKIEIEKELHKTDNTIKAQVKSILKKLNVRNLQDAIKKVKKRGL